jgi:hypothetical protein
MSPVLKHVTPNHSAYAILAGQSGNALRVFQEGFDWKFHHMVDADWGQAWFVISKDGVGFMVQLTDEVGGPAKPILFASTHFAVNVDHAAEDAQQVKKWADKLGIECEIDKADDLGLKWFVNFKQTFTFEFELVSRPKCAKCGGSGQIQNAIFDPERPTSNCPVCGGNGIDNSI